MNLDRTSLKHVSDSGTIAEEVLSSVRIAQAFGKQDVLASRYDEPVKKAEAIELKTSLMLGGAIGVTFFTIYASYALRTILYHISVFLLILFSLFLWCYP